MKASFPSALGLTKTFLFVQVVLCHSDIPLENFAIWRGSPCGQPHGGLGGIGTVVDEFGCRLSRHGIMQLVLHKRVEILGGLAVLIVVEAADVAVVYLVEDNAVGLVILCFFAHVSLDDSR